MILSKYTLVVCQQSTGKCIRVYIFNIENSIKEKPKK